MQSSTFHLERPDGVRLHVNQWLPDGDVKATVLIAHGMAEYGARYEHMAQPLTEAGYAVWAHDQRGHGKSVESDDELGHMADTGGWLLIVDDLKALHDRIVGEHPDVPHFLFGHSMGSFASQTFLFRHAGAVDGAIIQSTDSGAFAIYPLLRGVVGLERRMRGGRAKSIVPSIQSVLFNLKTKKRTKFDWIAAKDSLVDAYIADPYCGYDVTTSFWRDLGFGMKLNADPHNVDRIPKNLPVYLPHGDLCPVGDYGRGVKRLAKQYEKAGMTNVEIKTYEGLRHEIHNEENNAEVIADHIAWLDRQVDVIESRKSAA